MTKPTSKFSKLLSSLLPGTTDDDSGRGKLDDYAYDLRPKKTDVTIRLAESNPAADEIQRVSDTGAEEVWAMISRRTLEDERVDAPTPVRLFAGGRVSGIVGSVPRGLEAPVDDALGRLAERGKPPRIPASIVTTRGGALRVDLQIGETR